MPGGHGTPFPDPLIRFVELFNRGEHWESHEVLEGPWREGRSSFYHGLILFASAWVHRNRGNAHGVDAQMRKTLEALEGLPEGYLGVDVERVRKMARDARKVVREMRQAAPSEEDGAGTAGEWVKQIPPPRLELDPRRIRGDEPEAEQIRRPRS